MLTRFFITAWFIRTFRHRFVQKLRTPLEHPEAHMLFIKKKQKQKKTANDRKPSKTTTKAIKMTQKLYYLRI